MKAILGKKIGMTQVFDEHGRQIPVTVVQTGPCSVVQLKTREKDGYDAAQLGYGEQKEQRLTKALQGHFKKAEVGPRRLLKEVRLDEDHEVKVGDSVTNAIFAEIRFVDVTAVTKGRGFQGGVRRHGFGGGRKTHGGHMHRGMGSIGQKESPARVFKGKKMPGHMGNRQVTTQHLKVIEVREADNLLLLRGAIPGPNGGIVFVKKSIKKA